MSGSATQAKVLVVEDNTDLAYGLRNNLEIEGYDVRTAEDGEEGLRIAREWSPDLIVLDLSLPKKNGFQVLRELRGDDANTPVLILTARGEEAEKVLGFRSGADDYVTKPFGVLELLARIEAILRRAGGSPTSQPIAAPWGFGGIEVDESRRVVRRDGADVSLTPKEFDLLVALARRDGRVATRIELMRDVWGHRAAVASRTVDTHIAELRRKLETKPASPRHILTVHKSGYRLDMD